MEALSTLNDGLTRQATAHADHLSKACAGMAEGRHRVTLLMQNLSGEKAALAQGVDMSRVRSLPSAE